MNYPITITMTLEYFTANFRQTKPGRAIRLDDLTEYSIISLTDKRVQLGRPAYRPEKPTKENVQ